VTLSDVQPGPALVSRIRRGYRRHGPLRLARLTGERALKFVYLREVHAWYAADLTAPLPRRELDAGLELVRGTEDHVELLDGLPTVYPAIARSRLAEENDWWLVLAGGQPVFSCWVFHRHVPVLAADGGGLDLPSGIAFLEDSITSSSFRGRGVAPAAWTAVCDELAEAGAETLVTKVEVENEAVRRALGKVGFAEVGRVELVSILGRRRVRVDADDSPGGRLAASLRTRGARRRRPACAP
jgi:ribosomal protein S18 acetylase RimI-like enzyme